MVDTDTVGITVNAVNDAPINSVPAAQTTDEDTALTFSTGNGNLISISDVDASGDAMEVTVAVTNGLLSLAQTTGLTFSAGDGTSDATMTFTGSAADINAALDGLMYAPTGDYNGPASLTITTDDLGNNGSGGNLVDTDTVAVTVNAVNDAPINSVPVAQTTNEDTALTFSAGNGNLISVSDVDVSGDDMEVTVAVVNGLLSLAQTTGLTFSAGDGTSDATMTFTGSATDINAALDGLIYAPTGDYNGADTLTITTNDQGNNGSGGALVDTDTVGITVSAVNDAPLNSVPAAQTTNEDTALVFSTGNGNLISISDVDVSGDDMEVTVAVTNGLLSLAQTTGLTFSAGDGAADATMTFTGSAADINAALDGLSYAPTADYNGPATVTITTDDQGNNGSGGNLVDTDTVAVTVNAVNDAPINSVPVAQTTNEDTGLTFSSGNGNLISISDIDAAGDDMEVTVAVTNGLLTLAQTTGLAFSSGDGTSDATMTFTGSATDINAALDGLLYAPTGDYNGPATLTITTDDQGNNGIGGNLVDTDTVGITVNAVNDAPINSVPAAQTTNEDTNLTFSTGNGNLISISDIDASGDDMEVTVAVTNGLLSLAQTTGLTFLTGDGTSDATMTFTGSATAINAALDGLNYAPTGDYNGPATLTITTDDQGNNGSGGNLVDTDTVAITVNAVNDAPLNSVPPAQTTNEDTTLTFSGGNGNLISISDIDAAGDDMEVTVAVTNGLLTLAQTTGLTFTVGDGTSDATMTFSGSATDLNAALDGLGYAPTGDYNGPATLTITTDDLGNNGLGGALTDTDTVAITVSPVNDAPLNVVPAAQSTNEDTNLTFSTGNGNLVAVSDVDASGDDMTVTVAVTNGTLTLAQTTGLAFSAGDGTSDATMTFSGSATDINAALDGLGYAPTGDYNGPATLTIMTDDQGNNGSGGALTDTDTVAITVNAVNDAPLNNLPVPQRGNEDLTLVLSTANLNAISVSDIDANGDDLEVTLAVTNGVLTLAQTTGLTFSAGDGAADATMTFAGSAADINAALDGLAFDPDVSYAGPAALTITTSDLGNNGLGGALVDTDTLALTIDPVNDAPFNNVPATQTLVEDTSLTFSTGNGNLLSIVDLDANGGDMQVTVAVADGSLTLAQTTGLTFSSGDGTADGSMTFTGTITDINTALDGLLYQPNGDFEGVDTLTITTDDQGNTGIGGALTDTDTVAINVTAVNDAPINTVPVAQTTVEDTTLVFSSGNGNAISVSDVDVTSEELQVTLTAADGTLTLSQLTGLTFSAGDGTDDATMTFSGSAADINAALEGLALTPDLEFGGLTSLTITTDDQGNVGGGSLTDTDVVAVTVVPANDAPIHTVPSTQTVDEDSSLVFSTANGNLVSIYDEDAGGLDLQVTLDSSMGKLTLAQMTGLTFIAGDGSADSSMTFTGTQADINAALDGLTFDPNANYTGPASFQISTNDLGNTGPGGALTDTDTVSINVAPVNDAPTNSLPGPQTTAEDTPLVFSIGNGNLLSVNDIDAGSGDLEVTLSVTDGLLTLGQTTGLTFTTGDGSDEATMTFTGSSSAINAALDGLTFAPDADYNGAASLMVRTDDLGNSGSGGPLVSTDTLAINVTAVNDAPLQVVPAAQSVDEDTALVFSVGNGNSISVSDPDASGDDLQVTLVSSNGQLTLAQTAGLTFVAGDGSDDAAMTFRGSAADINAALEGMTFLGDPDFDGLATLSITTDDQGNNGVGGALTVSDTVAISVNPINDAPVQSVPGAQTVAEDTSLVFSTAGGNAISVNDIEVGSNDLEVTLTATDGTLTLAQTTGLSFSSGDGADDAALTFRGSAAAINAALDGMSFDGDANYFGAATVSIATNDLGNSGAGGALTTTDTIAVNVTAVNDAPTASAGSDQVVQERSVVSLDASATVDVDGPSLAYAWTQTGGPAVALTDDTLANPQFTSPDVTADTVLEFQVEVTDGEFTSFDTVRVTVQPEMIMGTSGVDSLTGAGTHDNIMGLGGDDTLRGGGGDDVIDGGAGQDVADYSDTTTGVEVDVTLDGVAQDTGEGGVDTLSNIEGVLGGSGDDTAAFTQGENGAVYSFDGGDGDDTLDLVDFSLADATFVGSSITIDLGGGDSFSVNFQNIESVQFGDASLTVLDGDHAATAVSGSNMFLENGQVFSVDVSGPGTVDFSYDADEDAVTLTGADSTDALTTVAINDQNGNDLTVSEVTLDSHVGTLLSNVDLESVTIADGAQLDTISVGSGGSVEELTYASDLDTDLSVDGSIGVLHVDGVVDANLNVGADLAVLEATSLATGTAITVGGYLGAIDVGQIDGGVDVSVNGDLGGVTVAGGIGAAGDLVSFDVDGNFGSLLAAADVHGEFDVAGNVGALSTIGDADFSGTLSVGGIDHLTIGGDLVASGTVNGDVDFIAVAGSMVGTNTFYVTGDVGEISIDNTGSQDIQIDGDLDRLNVTGDFTAVITIEQAFGAFEIIDGATEFNRDFSYATQVIYDGSTNTISHASEAPTLDAGADFTIEENSTVNLTANAFDPEGEQLTYQWTQVSGPTMTVSGGDTANATFDAPDLLEDTDVEFQVQVSDGINTTTDTVTVTIAADNDAPVISAGDDRSVNEGDTVTLAASGFDPEGEGLTYTWVQESGPEVQLDHTDPANPIFEAPNREATYDLSFRLEVSDGTNVSTDSVTITVDAVNDPVEANAGEDLHVQAGRGVTLDGTAVDPDSTNFTYKWTQVSGPQVGLENAESPNPSFSAPMLDKPAQLVFDFVVSDGENVSADTVTVFVSPAYELPEHEAPTEIEPEKQPDFEVEFNGGAVAEEFTADDLEELKILEIDELNVEMDGFTAIDPQMESLSLEEVEGVVSNELRESEWEPTMQGELPETTLQQFEDVQRLVQESIESGRSFEQVFAEDDNYTWDTEELVQLQQDYLDAEDQEAARMSLLWGLVRGAAGTMPLANESQQNVTASHREQRRVKD
ncbi:MAG: Ig-like domain-containing protein [Planctomycetota bacterium]